MLENDKGERLEAPELIWDEKTKEIYTDRFVKHTREDRVIYSHGFKSNESFTHYELHAVSLIAEVSYFNTVTVPV